MQNCNVNKNISIFPKFQGDNEYLLNLSVILGNNFNNVEFVGLPLKPMLKMALSGKRSDVLIINWLEDYPSLKKGFLAEAYGTLRFILTLLAANLHYREIVWVRHNYKPHLQHSKLCYRILCSVIRLVSKKVVTHRQVTEFKSVVIAHPLYARTKVDKVEPFDYLIFGNIKPYKNIPYILQNWDPNRELRIIGKCKNSELDHDISRLAAKKSPKVTYENRFLEAEELNSLLSSVTFVILGHEEASMIVSGTFYHAISYGANVIMKDSQYGRSVKSEFPLVHLVEDFGSTALSNLVPFEREKIIALANDTYSDSVIAAQWVSILAD